MNASQLYAGEEYAWKEYKSKGQIPIDAKKVILRSVEQHRRPGYGNRTTLATVTVADTGQEKRVRARDIFMFWDEYEPEQRMMLKAQRERDKKNRRFTLRNQIVESLVNFTLQSKNIPLTMNLNYSRGFSMSQESVLAWLGIDENAIEQAIDDKLAEEYPDET